jgi:hypothetical protein
MAKCVLCDEINYTGDQLKELARALLRLQRQIQPVIDSYQKARRSHVRCALCGILAGREHEVQELVPEPMVPRARGQKRYSVCDFCYTNLHKMRQSVPQRHKINARVDAMLKGDEAEAGDTDIDSLIHQVHNEIIAASLSEFDDLEEDNDDTER